MALLKQDYSYPGMCRAHRTTLVGVQSALVHHGIEAGSCSEWKRPVNIQKLSKS